ncbi:MAG: class I SAM-dependent methyltransferase [Chthoniobacter sp.]|uniref:class I SAM-dependent methyltransferase n=1 Tax=Chthoniobacter sp. TaxID=2510640 RepID=UPI0032A65ED1
MPDLSPTAFDALPYRHGAIPETHPARVGAIARLLGMEAAAPDDCRVLELGMAEGMNLLPLAERLPTSTFVGVDFSPVHVAAAAQARAAAAIDNARFVCADLRDYTPEAGAFDYVIAHGVYSWVPPEVRERLLALCAQALAPDGIAYVSYNVFPGWGLLGGLREMLRAEMGNVADPVAHAAKLLAALERAFTGQPGPYAALMREAIAEMRAKPPEMLFHDELELVNTPVTFLDFIAHTARHDLHYLAEAHFPSMPAEHLPPAARAALAEMAPDFFRTQHFLDLVGNRRFRSSLLTRHAPAAARVLDPAIIPQCAVGLHLQPVDGVIDLSPGRPLQLRGRHDFLMSVSAPAHKAFFAALCEVAPARVPFAAALRRATGLLHQSGFDETPEAGPLSEGLARLFAVDQCDLLLTGGGDWLDLSPAPAPSALMRYQAREGRQVTNRWHEPVTLDAGDRSWVAGEAASAREAVLVRTGLAV